MIVTLQFLSASNIVLRNKTYDLDADDDRLRLLEDVETHLRNTDGTISIERRNSR